MEIYSRKERSGAAVRSRCSKHACAFCEGVTLPTGLKSSKGISRERATKKAYGYTTYPAELVKEKHLKNAA